MSKPIWQKQLEKFRLMEFPKEPNSLNCAIHLQDDEFEETFAFGSWGTERQLITSEDCVLCCQAMLRHGVDASLCSFQSNLECAQEEAEAEQKTEIIVDERCPPPIKISVSLRMAPLLLRKIRLLMLTRRFRFEELILLRLDAWAWEDSKRPPDLPDSEE